MLLYEIRCLGCGRIIPEWASSSTLPLCVCGYSQRTIGPQYETLRPLAHRMLPPAVDAPPVGLVPADREDPTIAPPRSAPPVMQATTDLRSVPVVGPSAAREVAPDPVVRWRIARGLPPDGQERVPRVRPQRATAWMPDEEEPAPSAPRVGPTPRRETLQAASLQDRIVEVDVVLTNPTPHLNIGFAFESYWPCGLAGLQAPSARMTGRRRYEGYPRRRAYDQHIGAWR